MDKQPIFKTALFGGFERQSVLNYIFELNNNAKAVQDRLSAQFEEVSAAREKLSETIRFLEQRLADAERMRGTLSEELSGERAKNSELTIMLNSLNAEISRQNQIIQEKNAEFAQIEAIKAELEQRKAELEEQKAVVRRQNELIERGGQNSEEVERLRDELEQQKNEVRRKKSEIEGFKDELQEKEAQLRRNTGVDNSVVEELRAELERSKAEIRRYRDELQNKEDQFRNGGADSRQLDELRAELEQRKMEIQRYRDEMQGRDFMLRSSGADSRQLDELRAELERQRAEVRQLARLIENKDAEIRRLRETASAETASSLAMQREEVERASKYVGDLMVRARIDAERILDDANAQARQVVEDATNSLGTVFDQFSRFRHEVGYIEENIEDAVDSIKKKLGSIEAIISQSEEHIRKFYRPAKVSIPTVSETQHTGSLWDQNFFRDSAEQDRRNRP